jgi:peptide/nickel transport system substrate-binding protein
MKKWIALVLAGVIATLVLSACSIEQFRTSAAQVPRLVYSTLSDPKSFNAVLIDSSPNVSTLLYEGLVTENGLTAKLEPAIAESWQISPDHQTITFTLKDNLKWSDGQPLTVDDVVFTYNDVFFNEKIPSGFRDILRIGESGALPQVRKVDDRRVEFSTLEPFAPLLRFIGGGPILPKHALQASVASLDGQGQPRFLSMWGTNAAPKTIVGNGPYTLLSYRPGQRLIFQRNPYYWRKDAQGRQQPYVDRIVWQVVESLDASLVQFRSGGLDSVSVNPPEFSLLKQQEKQGNFTIYNGGPAFGTTFITFNLNQGGRNGKPFVDPVKSGWFNNLAFRQAVAYALDRTGMINTIYRGLGAPQNSPISVQSPYYLSPQAGLKVYDFNLEKARQVLAQAGFQYNANNQLLDADGNLVRFTLNTNVGNTTRESLGLEIKQDLAKIGIRVDFQPLSFNTLTDKFKTRNWDCILIGFSGSVEPNGGANFWQPTGRSHIFNLGQQSNEAPLEGRIVADWEAEIGRLMIEGARTLDEAKRKAIYARMQQVVQANLPCIYLVNPLSLTAVRDHIKGIKFSAIGGAFWNLYELQLE